MNQLNKPLIIFNSSIVSHIKFSVEIIQIVKVFSEWRQLDQPI